RHSRGTAPADPPGSPTRANRHEKPGGAPDSERRPEILACSPDSPRVISPRPGRCAPSRRSARILAGSFPELTLCIKIVLCCPALPSTSLEGGQLMLVPAVRPGAGKGREDRRLTRPAAGTARACSPGSTPQDL